MPQLVGDAATGLVHGTRRVPRGHSDHHRVRAEAPGHRPKGMNRPLEAARSGSTPANPTAGVDAYAASSVLARGRLPSYQRARAWPAQVWFKEEELGAGCSRSQRKHTRVDHLAGCTQSFTTRVGSKRSTTTTAARFSFTPSRRRPSPAAR
jgi:hypothetical protein